MADMGKSAREAGAESFNYGPASFRANANPPFRSFDDVSDARSRILPEQETTDIFDAFGARYNRVASEVADLTDINGFQAQESAFDFMNDYAKGNPRTMREWQGTWADNLSPEYTLRDVDALKQQAQELPVHYFEAKPQRAVDLGEFQGAIIPEGAADAEAILRKHGIENIMKYATPQERQALFQQFPELMFGIGGLAAAGGLLSQRQEEYPANGGGA